METKPQQFTFEKENGKQLNCSYFFSHEGINEGSGYIYLYIRPNDPERDDVHHIRVEVKEEIMEKPGEELERIAKSELASFYIINKASEK